jgi:hypothetical protein
VAVLDKGTRVVSTRLILKKGNQDSRKQKKNIQCHVGAVSVDGDGGGEDDCPIPFLNPLTKLRNGRRSQLSAPDGGGTTSVLARVRGLVSDSPSSGSRSRFLPAPGKAAPSTAVASVEATDNRGQFSDLSERLGLASEACTAACSL